MDIQTIVVAALIIIAIVYAGNSVRQKARSMKRSNENCGTDCGCGSSPENRVP